MMKKKIPIRCQKCKKRFGRGNANLHLEIPTSCYYYDGVTHIQCIHCPYLLGLKGLELKWSYETKPSETPKGLVVPIPCALCALEPDRETSNIR